MKAKLLIVLAAGLAALMMAPAGTAFHGSWWRARDLAASSPEMGLDHSAHPISTATDLASGEVYRADVQYSGQQFFFVVGTSGVLTIKLFDEAGVLAHQNSLPVKEDITNVHWIQCPAGTGSGTNLETLPTYSMIVPGILSLGPGAPGGSGMMRNSFCGTSFDLTNDPFYFKGFSDYEGTYLNYRLHLHVRELDHG